MKLPIALTHTFLCLCLGASMFALTAQQAAPPSEAQADRLADRYASLQRAGLLATTAQQAAPPSEASERPFQPPPFTPPANWKGKTVLAEVFTGSECPPCVAAGYGFDGLKESYPTQYLAILKYHLPIPRYDPMMNPATKKRQDYYGREIISGTPTAIIDGVKSVSAGGGRNDSLAVFNRAKTEIDSVLTANADVTIKATATLMGDTVQVNCEFSKIIQGADYNVVLVQTEEEFKGGNGIAVHKMVVRDIETVKPTDKATVAFNIPASEKAAGDYITEWGKTEAAQRRMQPSQWPAQHTKMDRAKLKAVVFVQDTNTRQVYNAFVADVGR